MKLFQSAGYIVDDYYILGERRRGVLAGLMFSRPRIYNFLPRLVRHIMPIAFLLDKLALNVFNNKRAVDNELPTDVIFVLRSS